MGLHTPSVTVADSDANINDTAKTKCQPFHRVTFPAIYPTHNAQEYSRKAGDEQNPEYDPKRLCLGWSLGSCTPVTRMRLAHRGKLVAHYAET
jgi:hypothetical protein